MNPSGPANSDAGMVLLPAQDPLTSGPAKNQHQISNQTKTTVTFLSISALGRIVPRRPETPGARSFPRIIKEMTAGAALAWPQSISVNGMAYMVVFSTSDALLCGFM